MAKASVWAAAAVTLLALTGCAETGSSNADAGSSSSPGRPRQCFWAREARNFAGVNSTTVNVRVGFDVYRINTVGTCRDLNWTNRMALVSRGNSMVCVGSGLGTSIVTRGTSGRQACAVQSISLLTPEQVEALPASQRP